MCIISPLSAQEAISIDSLIKTYKEKSLEPEEKLELLFELSYNSAIAAPERIAYGDTLVDLAKRLNNQDAMMKGHLYKAYAYMDMSDYDQDIQETLAAITIAKSIDSAYWAYLNNHLGFTYSKVNNNSEALRSFRKGLDILLNMENTEYYHLGALYFNFSDFYLRNNQLDSAYKYLELSKVSFDSINNDSHKYFLDGNLGVYYFKKGEYEKAKRLIESGADNSIESRPEAAVEYYNYLTDLAQEQNNYGEAKKYAERAISIGKNIRANSELANTYLNLYEIYLNRNDYAAALEHYKKHKAYLDSAINLPTIQRMANLRNEFEVANKQKEVDLMAKEAEIQSLRANRQRTVSIVSVTVVVLLSLLIFGLFNRFKYIRKTSRIIEKEKNRSDALLRNILPDETADELKENGRVKAKKFESVSVMFADFRGFTRYSEDMDPEELVRRVDFYFSRFDEIMEKFNLEKIKTMGDAYMCAGGLPFPSEDHAARMVMAAFEMAEFVEKVKQEDPDDPTRFEIRIGINTGPVIAGVVGTKKFVYDIWGDTVNIASRMESNSEPGRINVSENTYKIIKDKFECTFRGMVDVKNKGMMKMYFVNGLTEEKKKEVYREFNVTT
ncbi:adenylate/guanylate cyclase domain-containing protein [Robertkochia flava]|uniref:adenylate/guanylate cyclase domain-containing protein n=1 Tax=Robertkochia flava TaxID=3447986 RepID=UPI001CCA0369|nr:adenylate/guanylate cyclase domain-containing protein [Robertkochia marina]